MNGRGRSVQADRTIAIKRPFQEHPAAHGYWANAAVATNEACYRVVVTVSGPGCTSGIAGHEEATEEGRMLFSLIDLAGRSTNEFKRSQTNHFPEIWVTIPSGLGRRGEWTVDALRNHAREQLRPYNVSRCGSTWEARPKQTISHFEFLGP